MIIVGYQGIGKSTLADKDLKYIDLESSNFFVDGKRADNWYAVYCKIAVSLSDQGYDVFVSSHQVVRDELSKIPYVEKMIVCPSVELKDVWINKLQVRYESSINPQEKDKNYKAYMNAVDRYEDNIRELMAEKSFEICVIKNMNYDLEKCINGNNVEITEHYAIEALINIKKHMMVMSFEQYSQEVLDMAIKALEKNIAKPILKKQKYYTSDS